MTEQDKQDLIEMALRLKNARNLYGSDIDDVKEICEIALASLTAPPVKLPKGFNPGIGDIFDKAAPVMRRDATDGKWLHKADVTKILNELGYEVEE